MRLARRRRPAARTLARLILAARLLAAGAPGAGAEPATLAPPRPVDPTRDVRLVPLGPVPPALIADLVAHVRATLGLKILTLAPISLAPTAIDRDRVQVVAEELAGSLRRLPQHERSFLIGLTTYDMYIRRHDWEWAFAYRDGEHAIVISTARMDETNWGLPPAPDRLRARLRKMVARNLGLMYYGLRPSSDRRSVLFGTVLGLDDLDALGEALRP